MSQIDLPTMPMTLGSRVEPEVWMCGVPIGWFRPDCLSDEEAEILLKTRAQVAQKCTGRAKKPVFLLPDKVVKGPWLLPQEHARLNRELGCSALMKHWAMPEHPMPVLQASLFAHRENQRVYMVTSAMYRAPTTDNPWLVESESRSVSGVGPRILEVISRASTGVIRVSDRLREMPSYLLQAPEIWEHLIHRCILQCGDSGFHNMLVDPITDRAVGIDLDERRRGVANNDLSQVSLFDLLFKSPPARKLHPWIEQSLTIHRDVISAILKRLEDVCFDGVSDEIVTSHQIERGDWLASILALRQAMLG